VQRLNRLIDAKYATNNLLAKEILQKADAGGRSTNYEQRITHQNCS
jgi:hypothetical protein